MFPNEVQEPLAKYLMESLVVLLVQKMVDIFIDINGRIDWVDYEGYPLEWFSMEQFKKTFRSVLHIHWLIV